MTHSQPASGQFVWYNLVTGDPVAEAAFYARLFGWATRGLHLGGAHAATTWRSGEHDVGGLVTAASGPSHWLPLLAVEDADAALVEACRLGGTMMPPPSGPSGVVYPPTVFDPIGAPFCLVGAAGPSNHPADAAIPGHFCWSELLTTEPSQAAAFYGALVGWATLPWDVGTPGRYWLFRRGGRDLAGMMRLPDDAGQPSSWLPYVQVVSAEETAALAEEFGGVVVTPPGDVPGRGRSAVIEDPSGARVAVFALTAAA
jgi:predicted enzyme related to lactoylglutathione lyase